MDEKKQERMAVGVRFEKELSPAQRTMLKLNVDNNGFDKKAKSVGYIESEIGDLIEYVHDINEAEKVMAQQSGM